MEFWVPYGDTEVPVRVPDENFYKIVEPNKPSRSIDTVSLLTTALDNPIDGRSLADLVKSGPNTAIVMDSMVPPQTRQATLELLRTRLSGFGAASPRVFLRKRISNLPRQKPEDTADGYHTIDPSHGSFRDVGRTSYGTPVFLDNDFLECDTKICVSLATPHFASSFTGGPEGILPGVSSADTTAKNRSLVVRGLAAWNDNTVSPMLADSLEACKLAGPIYNIAFVPDGWGGLDSVFAGELEAAFKLATSRYLQIHRPKIDRRADIVMVSAGKALGSDLYHAVRVISNIWDVVKREGTIILVAECLKGVGDSTFLELSRKFEDKRELLSELRHHFRLGGHVSLLLQEALDRHRVQLVSVLPDHYARNSFRLKPSRTASGAVQTAVRVEGKDAKILIVPRGELSLPLVAEAS